MTWHDKSFGSGDILPDMDELDAAVAEHRHALQQVEDTRLKLHEQILKALARGVIQAELVRRTGYTRERLRQLAREADEKSAH